MAASAVGGWVASAFITKLVEKVCTYAGDQYEYQRKDTKEKLSTLEKNLSSIQTAIHIAERVQAKNIAMGSWLRRIKDAACQAEDVLDLFDYRVLQAQAEDRGMISSVASAAAGSSSSSSSTVTTASTTTSSSSSSTVNQSVRLLKRFLFSDEDIDDLISVVNKFVEIDSEMQRFLEFVKIEDSKPEQAVQWRTTSSMPSSEKFFGRVNEENNLKKLLVQINEQSSQPYDVISIVGIGGVGKTALVQRVYNHFHDTHHFDLTVEQKEDDIISVLRPSYEHLPDHLKQCFVYFALFPKKYHLRGDELIQMWRAHGFLDTQTPDETARRYINDLLQLLFIEKVPNQEDHYVVHDLLHDFAESVSNGEHFRIEDDFNVCIPRNVRHLYVSASNILKVYMSLEELKKNLRSLIISKAQEGASCERVSSSNFNHILEHILKELRSLRVLVLCNPDGMLPDSLDHLVHLRYLNIHESRNFINVPKSLFKLYHLQGLSLQTQDRIMKKELQEGLSRLTQLRYLKAPKKIISSIELIGRPRSLKRTRGEQSEE
uniref:Rx N-terminal domain-containing protein n=1 Tax=Aegilops tauschii subsp. strangulata TaxID=200361 RepID=A0A453ADC3_AEGTS